MSCLPEVWKPIPNKGGYEASCCGEVRSVDQVLVNRFGIRRQWKGTVLVGSVNDDGYRHVIIRGRTIKVASLVAQTFHGPKPAGLVVRHRNGDNSDDSAGNLLYGTQSQNILDSVQHGTHPNARKTHCPNGHEYSEENTHLYKSGHRRCRTCHRERENARYHHRKVA